MDQDENDTDVPEDVSEGSLDSESADEEDAAAPRSHKKQERLTPSQDPDLACSGQGCGKRWSEKTVIFIVFQMSKHFTWQHLVSLQEDGKWPLSHAESTAMWRAVTADINAYLDKHDPDEEIDRWSAEPGAAWRVTASKWFVKLAREGNVQWKPSNPAGFRVEKLRPVLEEMADILVAGITQPDGQVIFFTSLDEAAKLVPRFRELQVQHKLCNPRTLWKYLKIVRPRLRFTMQPIKRPRDAPDVQVWHLHHVTCAPHACVHAVCSTRLLASSP